MEVRCKKIYTCMCSTCTCHLNLSESCPVCPLQEEQLQYYSDINELHTGLEEEGLEPYLERFREEAEAEAVMVGKMSLHQIQVCVCVCIMCTCV